MGWDMDIQANTRNVDRFVMYDSSWQRRSRIRPAELWFLLACIAVAHRGTASVLSPRVSKVMGGDWCPSSGGFGAGGIRPASREMPIVGVGCCAGAGLSCEIPECPRRLITSIPSVCVRCADRQTASASLHRSAQNRQVGKRTNNGRPVEVSGLHNARIARLRPAEHRQLGGQAN